jgi:hypothetical protein
MCHACTYAQVAADEQVAEKVVVEEPAAAADVEHQKANEVVAPEASVAELDHKEEEAVEKTVVEEEKPAAAANAEEKVATAAETTTTVEAKKKDVEEARKEKQAQQS